MSKGNFRLTTTCEAAYVGEFNQILMSIRNMNRNMSTALREVGEAAEQVSAGSDNLAQASQDLAEGATDQAASVQQMLATMQTISAGINESAEQMNGAYMEAENCAQKAQLSREEMTNMVHSMNRISETSKKIEDIISQIESIASQTNLLSLNASIEAARAGDAGRGFAVVAGEIGNLASSSTQTVAEIQGICNNTKQNIEKVEECFENIISFMEQDVKIRFEEFVSATNEYNTSIGQIKDIINDMSECSDVFVKAVSDIQNQIDAVQGNSTEENISTEDMLVKVERTRKTTEDMADIISVNEKNAGSIREIVGRFTS